MNFSGVNCYLQDSIGFRAWNRDQSRIVLKSLKRKPTMPQNLSDAGAGSIIGPRLRRPVLYSEFSASVHGQSQASARARFSSVVLACSLPLRTNHRENQGERCSACSGCSLAAQMHAAAVSRQNTRCYPKSQTGPRRSFRCKKWIVNLPSRFPTHAETGIRNRDTHPDSPRRQSVDGRTRTRNLPPDGIASNAFLIRFASTCLISPAKQISSGSPLGSTSKATFVAASFPLNRTRTDSINCTTLVDAGFVCCVWNLSVLLAICAARWTSSSAWAANACASSKLADSLMR